MSDIRINALATTATTPASDDFLALDGAAQGTRKILATNIANNVTDVILGTSGPSVKSSLAARAARQGLVFDGTAGATVSGVPAFGTNDFTILFQLKVSAWPAAAATITQGITGSLDLYYTAAGAIIAQPYSGSSLLTVASAVTLSENASFALIRSGSTLTLYKNGTVIGSASGISNNFTTAETNIGGISPFATTGTLSVLIYNRALSATEVVSLYESGVPSGADYNTAGTTDIKPSAGTYAYWFGTGSISSATASSFTIVAGASNLAVRNVSGTLSVITGRRYRATIVASGLNASCDFGSQGFTSNLSASNISNGTSVIEFTATNTASGYFAISSISSTAGGSISISSIQALGLLLAPDAAQAGGGLAWYDTSGNAANITLPASGVTWNVPTSGYFTAPTTTNLTLAGGSTGASLVLGQGAGGVATISRNLTVGASAFAVTATTGNLFLTNSTAAQSEIRMKRTAGTTSDWILYNPAGSSDLRFYENGDRFAFTSTGNLIIGSPFTDGGQKLQVNGAGRLKGSDNGGGVAGAKTLSLASANDAADLAFNFNSIWSSTGQPLFLGSNATLAAVVSLGGNLLLKSDGIDSSNGKLQLATHTTSAGGIGFGPDTSLYRAAAANLVLDSASNTSFQLYKSGVSKSQIVTDGTITYIDTSSSFQFRTNGVNGTTALTLASNQAATFAGDVAIVRSYPIFYLTNTGAGAGNWVQSVVNTTGQFRIGENGVADWLYITKGTGAVNLINSSPSTGAGSGALQVAGGIYAGAASVFGGSVSLVNASDSNMSLTRTGGVALALSSRASSAVVGSAGSLVLESSNTTALTLAATTGAATFAGTVIAPAATTAISSVRLPHGTAPTSPVNGDMWTTTAGLYVRINGVTVGPLS